MPVSGRWNDEQEVRDNRCPAGLQPHWQCSLEKLLTMRVKSILAPGKKRLKFLRVSMCFVIPIF